MEFNKTKEAINKLRDEGKITAKGQELALKKLDIVNEIFWPLAVDLGVSEKSDQAAFVSGVMWLVDTLVSKK